MDIDVDNILKLFYVPRGCSFRLLFPLKYNTAMQYFINIVNKCRSVEVILTKLSWNSNVLQYFGH